MRAPLEADEAPVAAARRAPRLAAVAKPHVCFVAPTTWPVLAGDASIRVVGGAEVQQSMIAPGLARRGWRVSMICLDYGQPDRAEAKGVTVHRIHKPDEGIPVLRFVHPRLTSIWRALKRVDADVYYQRTSAVTTAYMAQFCRMNGRRSVYAGASDVDFVPGEEDIRYARDRRIYQWGVRRVDEVIVQNEVQRRTLREHYGREGVMIPSCYVPPAGARGDPAGYVLWASRVGPSKRCEMLFELARRLPRHRFVMIGGPDPGGEREAGYRRAMEEAARTIPNLEVRGFVPFAEAERAFDGARVVLNTSLYEGFPNTFLQAWSRGIPTVGFIDTGSRRGGEPAYDIASDVADAAARIERLMADDAHWRAASRRAAAHFAESHSIDAVLDQYERVLALPRGGA
ncbi:MAG TPA: glycosyltransferase family 4 protein [Usitatibacter sp.]|nr:glycosyltransferase family 4 protein [Usitatibacter sp.]